MAQWGLLLMADALAAAVHGEGDRVLSPWFTSILVRISGPVAAVKIEHRFHNRSYDLFRNAFCQLRLPPEGSVFGCRVVGGYDSIGDLAIGRASQSTGGVLNVPIDYLPLGAKIRIETEFAQELTWRNDRLLELRLPAEWGDIPGLAHTAVDLDEILPGLTLSSNQELDRSFRSSLGRRRVDVRGWTSGGLSLRLELAADRPQPFVLTHRGCFLIGLPAGWHPELDDLRWIDHGFGLSAELPVCGFDRERPRIAYGRHDGDGELGLEGSTRHADWHARLRAVPCDNPAIAVLGSLHCGAPPKYPTVSRISTADRVDPPPPADTSIDTLAVAVASVRRGFGCWDELERALADVLAWFSLGGRITRRNGPCYDLAEEGAVLQKELQAGVPVIPRLERYVKLLRGMPPDCRCPHCLEGLKAC